ncbi:replicative DNA helicase [Edaphovirga cremea]|uniref:replicative DNA helicase n=1 Tax=Edaphovirga cremea TaxID=2267246 RepID=UPI000DEFA473|nr:replicative DNA helicase [Edaphovirga cremea]
MTTEELEGAVIGAVLLRGLDADTFEALIDLPENAFSIGVYRNIWREMKQLAHGAGNLDGLVLIERLGNDYEAVILSAPRYVWAKAGLVSYVQMVKRAQVIRNFQQMAADALKCVVSSRNQDDALKSIATLRDGLQSLETSASALSPVHIDALLPDIVDRLQQRLNGDGSYRTLQTGIAELDSITGGIDHTDLMFIGARPSMGKTALALHLMEKITDRNGGVLLFSMEMAAIQIAERQVANAGSISVSKLKYPQEFTDEDWGRFDSGIREIAGRPIWIVDASNLTADQICMTTENHKREHPELAAVFVDYLGLVNLPGDERYDLKVGSVTKKLKSLSKRIRVPSIVLSQLSRTVETRMNKRPMNADLKNSGEIEADADIIAMLYRDEVYNPDTPAKGITEIIITKNRNGPLGTVYRSFQEGHFMPVDQAHAERLSKTEPVKEKKTRRYSELFLANPY